MKSIMFKRSDTMHLDTFEVALWCSHNNVPLVETDAVVDPITFLPMFRCLFEDSLDPAIETYIRLRWGS